MHVTTRSGKSEVYDETPIRELLIANAPADASIDVDAIVAQLRYELYEGISTNDIHKALIMVVRAMIERDHAYSKLAARLLLKIIYEEVLGQEFANADELNKAHKEHFKKNIEKGVNINRLDKRLLDFRLDYLAEQLDLERDFHFDYLGLQTLYDRYFVKDDTTKKIIETPQSFWMRIAMGTALLKMEQRVRNT